MSAQRYHVVFKGEIADGYETATVKEQLAALFKVPAATVERMFQGQVVKLKKDVDQPTALKYQAAVERTGARCHVVPAAEPGGLSLEPIENPDPPAPERPAPSLDKAPDHDHPTMDSNLSVHAGGNFYAPPGATLTDEYPGEVAELREPQRVPAGRAMRWVSAGFDLFKQNPGVWIVVMVLWLVIIMVVSIIPLISLGVNLLTAILVGGLMLGCRDQDDGEPLQVGHLFAGFQNNAGRLAAVGGLQVLAFLALGILMAVLMFSFGAGSMAMMGEFNPNNPPPGPFLAVIAIPLLIGMALGIPIAMAFWFAPLLVAVHDVAVFESIRLSFMACLRNWLGFLLYGIILMVLFIVAMIPLGLGLLVMGPVAMASVYTSHKDIFLDNLD